MNETLACFEKVGMKSWRGELKYETHNGVDISLELIDGATSTSLQMALCVSSIGMSWLNGMQ